MVRIPLVKTHNLEVIITGHLESALLVDIGRDGVVDNTTEFFLTESSFSYFTMESLHALLTLDECIDVWAAYATKDEERLLFYKLKAS